MPPPEALGILLLSGDYDRAHYAFMLATAAAAIGRPVTLFATNAGCHALARDWSPLAGARQDAKNQAAGVAGLDDLRAAAIDLAITLMACDSGLRIAGLPANALLPTVQVVGIPTFLAASKGQLVTF